MFKKICSLTILSILVIQLQAFCYQATRTCNEWDVQNQVTSLGNWGSKIHSVRCENPYADIKDRRWVITYEQ